MRQFGGVFINSNMILTESMDWVVNIDGQGGVRNKFDKQPNMVMLYNAQHTDKEIYIEKGTKNEIILYPSFEKFFIAVNKNSKFT
jgi:hypothetical protein